LVQVPGMYNKRVNGPSSEVEKVVLHATSRNSSTLADACTDAGSHRWVSLSLLGLASSFPALAVPGFKRQSQQAVVYM
jgi:hypothetical protein